VQAGLRGAAGVPYPADLLALFHPVAGSHVDVPLLEVRGEGQEGEVAILFLVVARRRVRALLRLLQAHDPKAFVTFENVQRAMGGHVPSAGFWPLVRR